MRLSLSQYRELESFAAFASDLDATSKAQLERGARLVELLKQPQYSPYPVERQVVSLWIGNEGYLDDVPLEDVRRFESEFLDEVQRSHEGIYTTIRETGALGNDTVVALKDAVEKFRTGFEKTGGELLVAEPAAEPLDADEVEQETIKKYTPPPAAAE